MGTLKNFVGFAETLNSAYRLKHTKNTEWLRNSVVPTEIKVITTFSLDSDLNNIKLPLLCSGRLITAGEYFDSTVGEKVILSEEELKKSLDMWEVPIMKSHAVTEAMRTGKDISIDNIVGKVSKHMWGEGGIDWEGFIVDEDLARKIAFGLIKFGSVTFSRDIVRREDGKLYYSNIKPLDYSLVPSPKDKLASVHVGGLQ